MLVGQAGGDKKPPTPPPATPAVASSCGQDCGCDGHGFRGRLRGLFRRNSDSCCTPAPAASNCCDRGHGHARQSFFRSRCEDACRPRLFNFGASNDCCESRGHRHGQANCNDCDRGGFLDRLRGLFRRDRCCDSGCGTTTTTPKTGEKIDPPKVMPKGGDKKPANEEVRINTPPATLAPATIQTTPAPPAIEIVPVPAPRGGESLRREP
jgi:hypothetical protein